MFNQTLIFQQLTIDNWFCQLSEVSDFFMEDTRLRTIAQLELMVT